MGTANSLTVTIESSSQGPLKLVLSQRSTESHHVDCWLQNGPRVAQWAFDGPWEPAILIAALQAGFVHPQVSHALTQDDRTKLAEALVHAVFPGSSG